jgi:disulfide bond formation protein DsbB
MSWPEVHDFFAVLALVAAGGAVVLVLARLIPSVATVRLLDAVYKVQVPLAALVATTAMFGSLYFSEVAHLAPCRFCWFQRIFMYSAALVLLVAAFRRDRGVRWYVVALALVGTVASVWHTLLEHGVIADSKVCSTTVPCATPYYVSFGSITPEFHATGLPVTLAVMAFCGFAAILALLLAPQPLEDEQHGQPSAS